MSQTATVTATVSPLEGLEHQTLDELLSRDPLSLADKDIETIVSVLRAQRAKWQLAESAPPKAKAAGPKRAATSQDVENLMKELDL